MLDQVSNPNMLNSNQRPMLGMIIRNESNVLARCLGSVRDHVQSWTISDTGSDDGSQELVRQLMGNQPGSLLQHHWHDFSTNRNYLLDAAAPNMLFTLDADETLVVEPGFKWPVDNKSGYTMDVWSGGIRFRRICMFNLAYPWRYNGAIHEYAHLDSAEPSHIKGAHILSHGDGNRSDNLAGLKGDIAPLLKQYDSGSMPVRSAFLLGETYFHLQDWENAKKWYLRASTAKEDIEYYTWKAYNQLALVKLRLNHEYHEVLSLLDKAFELAPEQAESLYYMARIFRIANLYDDGLKIVDVAKDIAIPESDYPVNVDIYRLFLPCEKALCLYGKGKLNEAAEIFSSLLELPKIPDQVRLELVRNLKLCNT